MPMPKGYKSTNGYATKNDLGGKTYHEISDEMQSQGFKMNHSTARNVFVNSLEKIAKNVTDLYQLDLDSKELKRIAKDPRFQTAIMSFMYEIE
tara:strand:- start:228 stop:506 length:279 start_codon:yes stop_codon:yes gene_type:complete